MGLKIQLWATSLVDADLNHTAGETARECAGFLHGRGKEAAKETEGGKRPKPEVCGV